MIISENKNKKLKTLFPIYVYKTTIKLNIVDYFPSVKRVKTVIIFRKRIITFVQNNK